MTSRLPSASLFRLWAWTMLAVIGLQVIIPISPPLQMSRGSAFGAATYDTALVGQRRDETGEAALLPLPLDPWLPVTAMQPQRQGAVLLGLAPFALATGPLAHSLLFWRHAARAPPLA